MKSKPSKSKALVPARRKPAPKPTKPVRQELVLSPEAAEFLAGPRPPTRPEVADVVRDQVGLALTDDLNLLGLGQVFQKFSDKANQVLDEPVNVADVRVKPTGQVYLGHPTYTKWLNRAFGRGVWMIVPVTRVQKTDNLISQDYMLFVEGKPAAAAKGEQEFLEKNREQTYGDAIEATYANALRRVCKRLGIGLELWDKLWIEEFLATYCCVVMVEEFDGKRVRRWRRKDQRPLLGELGPANKPTDQEPRQEGARPAPAPAAPPKAQTPDPLRDVPPAQRQAHAPASQGDRPITEPQLRRLWTIAHNAGRSDAAIKAWLLVKGIESTKDIKQRDYDAIVRAIETPGPLMMQGREPGQEG